MGRSAVPVKDRQPYCREQACNYRRLWAGEESDLFGFYVFLYGCAYDCGKSVFPTAVLFLLDIYDCADEMHGRKVAEKFVRQGI